MQLDGKVALVTGGSSGIGRATAVAFALDGARVVVASRRVEKLEETVSMIKEAGGESAFVQTDVTKADQVEAMVDRVLDVYGRLDYAFNNAGGFRLVGGRPRPMTEFTEEIYDRVVEVNLKGVWLCLKYEIPAMLKHGGGAIVNTSSDDGLRGAPNMGPYVASKHGVIGLTRTAALDYATQGIRVNAVCPGWIRTAPVEQYLRDGPLAEQRMLDKIPMRRLGAPEEVAEAVVWLCSDAASYVTGHALTVDGGCVA